MAKDTVWYKGKYFQGGLSDDQADTILSLVNDLNEVKSLKHCIKNVPDFIVRDIKKDAENYLLQHGTYEGFVHNYQNDLGLGTLREAQTVGVAFMYFAGSALLGDEVGLGKTVQIAGLCNVLAKEALAQGRDFRYLFLTEKSSAGQIRDKMIQFTGEFVELLENGEKKTIEDYIAIHGVKKHCSFVGSHSVINNSQFLTHTAQNPFDLVIIDESSVLKKSSSELYTNCRALFRFIPRKILLNATPVEIEVRDMYNQLDLLHPDYMPTITDFNRQFTKKKRGMFGWVPDGYKNEEIFREAIALRYLARTRTDLGAKYSGNRYKTILIKPSDEQKILSKKTTLYQMVTDFPTGVDRRVPYNEYTTPKLAVLFNILHEAVNVSSNQALVYCRFIEAQKQMKEMLEERGYRVVILNGRSSTSERANIVSEFNRGMYDIMITNVLKGIDLDSCNYCILYTIDPNPQRMVQFEGRITRELDVVYKSVYLLVAMGKEKKFVEEKLKLRVNASDAFSNTGRSMVASAIKSDGNKEVYEGNLEISFYETDK